MSTFNRRLKPIGLLSISAAVGLVIVAAASTGSQAQIRVNSVSIGPRGGMGGGGASMGGTTFRTEPHFQRFHNDSLTVTGDDGGPSHRPPGKHPPRHTGAPIIGTGVAGPAGAGPLRTRGGLYLPPPNELRYLNDEVLAEYIGQVSSRTGNAAATRNGLVQLESLYLPLTNTTWFRWKITNGSPVTAVLNRLGRERGIAFRQPHFVFVTVQSQGGEGAEPKAEAKPDTNAGMTLQAAPQSTPEPKPAAAAAAAPVEVAAPAAKGKK